MAQILEREDILLDSDGDFPIEDNIVNGVFLDTRYGFSDNQHQQDIIVYDKGWLSHTPTIGFGVNNYLNSEYDQQLVEKLLRTNFESDKYKTKTGIVSPSRGGGFIIDTRYSYRN